jgi:uncharacterized membrane protein
MTDALKVARPRPSAGPPSSGKAQWRVPAAFILLCAIPFVAGAYRLVALATGAEITPENARFFGAPLPVVLHITCAVLFIVLGAIQFVASFRRRHPGWHRRAGRVAVVSGLVVASSALWMTLFYALPAQDGVLLYGFRLLFGSLMAVSLVLAYIAIRRRQIPRHRAWMMRAYAIGLGAGTPAVILLLGEIVSGKPTVLARALLMAAAWVINLAVAEWIIRRQPAPRPRSAYTFNATARDQRPVAIAP